MSRYPSIPDVHLFKEVGEGAFGKVYKGMYVTDDEFNGVEVAVKCLSKMTPQALKMFEREAVSLERLSANPNIVSVYEWSTTHDIPYIVLEYCEYGSLRDWCRQNSYTWDTVVAAMAHALRGVEAIHRLGGFHRDIKPDNMLVAKESDGSLSVKISDLGLTRLPKAGSEMTRSPWGTEGYWAPEVAAGGDYSLAADIYSLGITFCELLTGNRNLDSLQKANAPKRVRELIWQMASARSSLRPSAQVVAGELNSLLAEVDEQAAQRAPESPQHVRRTVAPRQQKPMNLAPWLVGGGLLVGLGLLAAGVARDRDS